MKTDGSTLLVLIIIGGVVLLATRGGGGAKPAPPPRQAGRGLPGGNGVWVVAGVLALLLLYPRHSPTPNQAGVTTTTTRHGRHATTTTAPPQDLGAQINSFLQHIMGTPTTTTPTTTTKPRR